MVQAQDKIALRGRTVGMKEAGQSTAAICQGLRITHKTVNKWWRRWREEGSLNDHAPSGAPRMTTPEDAIGIIAQVTNHQ